MGSPTRSLARHHRRPTLGVEGELERAEWSLLGRLSRANRVEESPGSAGHGGG